MFHIYLWPPAVTREQIILFWCYHSPVSSFNYLELEFLLQCFRKYFQILSHYYHHHYYHFLHAPSPLQEYGWNKYPQDYNFVWCEIPFEINESYFGMWSFFSFIYIFFSFLYWKSCSTTVWDLRKLWWKVIWELAWVNHYLFSLLFFFI